MAAILHQRAELFLTTRRVQKLKSRSLTIVVVEHSTEPLVPSYSAVRRDRLHWNNETILESLMVPLQMIMRHKLANRIPQRVLTKEDHLLQAILPNRSGRTVPPKHSDSATAAAV